MAVAMKISVRPLKGAAFDVEMEPAEKVEDMKQKIAVHRPEFPAEQQTLIYRGQILVDTATVQEYDIRAGYFVVVMVAKVKPPTSCSPALPAEQVHPQAPTPAHEMDTLNTSTVGCEVALAAIQSQPGVLRLAAAAARDPEVLAEVLPVLEESQPDLAQTVHEDPMAFLQMLQGGAQGRLAEMQQQLVEAQTQLAALQGTQATEVAVSYATGPPHTDAEELTEEEHMAVQSLVELGFAQQAALQAYLACNKNKDLAANLLFDA